MKFEHDRIKGILPEYLKGALSEEIRKEIESHLNDCAECSGELTLISGLMSIEAPDPGEMFWVTFSRKVRKSIVQENAKGCLAPLKSSRIHGWLRSLLYRQLPAAAAIAVLFFAVYTFINSKKVFYPDSVTHDPFAADYLEYDYLTEEDIPAITDNAVVSKSYADAEDILEYSYYKELVSLNSDEMKSLVEALKKEHIKGG